MKKEEITVLDGSNTKPDETGRFLSIFHLKFSGLVKLQAETEAGRGTENPAWIATNKNICKNCQAVKPPNLPWLYLLVIRKSKYFKLGWTWFDTELTSEVSVKASSNSSERPFSASLYVLSSWFTPGMKLGKRGLDFSVCHRWPGAFGEGLSPGGQRETCLLIHLLNESNSKARRGWEECSLVRIPRQIDRCH